MSPRRPKTLDIVALIDALSSTDALERESAVARLAIAGLGVAAKLVAVAADPNAAAHSRAAALRALAAQGGPQALSGALTGLEASSDAVALEAIDILGAVVHGEQDGASDALDQLTGLALSPHASTERRLAAIEVLHGLPEALMRPVYHALASDPSSRIVAQIIRHDTGAGRSLEEIAARVLPETPGLLMTLIHNEGGHTAVTALLRLVEMVREREGITSGEERGHWLAVRGQLHESLASRDSHLAVYDLRETIEQAAAPLPIGFLSAAMRVADAGCLEAVASAWTRSAGSDRWFRDHLVDVFRAIVTREGLIRGHATLTAVLTRHPSAGVLVATAPRRRSARVNTPWRTRV